jgi:hypothetical protein
MTDMQQRDLFGARQDRLILALWRDGRNAEEIAALIGLPETRVFHELNRILNEQAGHAA